MAKQEIRVRLVGDGMIPDYEAMEDGVMRFHGWRHDPNVGREVTVFARGDKKGEKPVARKVRSGGFVKADGDVDLVLPFRAEYLQEVQAGSLIPLDEESARLCGVPFKSLKS